MTIRYIGQNGLEYLTQFDAEKYGEGLKQTIEHIAPRVIEHEEPKVDYDTLKPLGHVEVEIPSIEKLEKTASKEQIDPATAELFDKVDAGSIEVLKEIAKSLDIKGANLMKRENLIEKIKKATLLKKNLA